jgi:hypothetical protein
MMKAYCKTLFLAALVSACCSCTPLLVAGTSHAIERIVEHEAAKRKSHFYTDLFGRRLPEDRMNLRMRK